MTELIIWKNREIDRLRRDIERTFRRCCAGFDVPESFMDFPEVYSVNLSETEQAIVVTAKLPGMKPEDMDISVTENTLTIKGETKESTIEKGESYRHVDRRVGAFSRTVSLPRKVKVDEIEATYKDDILEITMPKRDPIESRWIRVNIK